MKTLVNLGMAAILLGMLCLNTGPALAAGTTITVNTVDGTGAADGRCSLPEAVTAADTGTAQDGGACTGGAGPYTIAFNIPGSGVHTITLNAGLSISAQVLIDGTTQPSYVGTPLIRVDGNNTLTGGFSFGTASEGSTIKGLMITRFTNSQIFIGAGNAGAHVTLTGNYIGTDGTNALGGNYGVSVIDGQYAQIGGPATTDRNVIAGNSLADVAIYGSSVSTDHNVVQGNYIGTNAAGTAVVGAGDDGVFLSDSSNHGASNNLITGNLISGHTRSGVYIAGQYNTNNTIQSNSIGTDASGSVALANADGIQVSGGINNIIGGNGDPSKRNLISGNGIGIDFNGGGSTGTIIKDNVLGMNAAGSAYLNNTNTGIYLYGDTVATLEANWIAHAPTGIYMGTTSAITSGTLNCLTGNTTGLDNLTGAGVTFTNNWWNDASGPYNASGNPSGTGDPVSNNVTFSPFDTTAEPICLPATSLSTTSLVFGNQLVTSSAIKPVTLTNSGAKQLTLTSISISAPYSLDGSGTCPIGSGTLAAGASCAIMVRFTPAAAISYPGSVTVTTDAVSSPDIISLSGMGVMGTQLLKNSSFEADANNDKKPDGWGLVALNVATDGRDCTVRKSGLCSLKLVGNGATKTASETILKNGIAGDDFAFSLFSRAMSVPAGATYRLAVYMYNGSSLIRSQIRNFAIGTHGFTKVAGGFTAPSPYTKLIFKITYQAASGTAWFDPASFTWAP